MAARLHVRGKGKARGCMLTFMELCLVSALWTWDMWRLMGLVIMNTSGVLVRMVKSYKKKQIQGSGNVSKITVAKVRHTMYNDEEHSNTTVQNTLENKFPG